MSIINSAISIRRNEADHQALVRWLANYLVNKGYTDVHADLPEWKQPTKIKWNSTGEGHIPDAVALAGSVKCIFEVETSDTISIQHTKDQWTLFDRYAREHNAALFIVVPDGYQTAARRQLLDWGLSATVW